MQNRFRTSTEHCVCRKVQSIIPHARRPHDGDALWRAGCKAVHVKDEPHAFELVGVIPYIGLAALKAVLLTSEDDEAQATPEVGASRCQRARHLHQRDDAG